MLVRVLMLAFVLVPLVGGCSISGMLPDWTSDDAAGPEPDYRYLIGKGMGVVVGDPTKAGPIAISSPHRVESLKGAAWLVCVKASPGGALPRYHAVFLQRGEIVDSRQSVLVDNCEGQTFTAYDWAAAAKNPR